ncbi:protein of unknown function [Pararobbsia alpina]|uniref:hypothetical protein n=1 Tax=Pararobbsia alpina TaxID=621374 RepID=UPI0039A7029E
MKAQLRGAAIRFFSNPDKVEFLIDVCGWTGFIAGLCGAVLGVVVNLVLVWPHLVAYLAK